MTRLFLSHAAKSASSLELVSALARRLTDAGYDVFEYKRDLETGAAWRFALLTALVSCDVGLVIKDERAVRRKWVRYEQGVLAARETTPFGRCAVVEVDVARTPDVDAIVASVDSARARGRDQ